MDNNNENQEEELSYIKMDYSLETKEERVKKVQEIIDNTPSEKLTPHYLEKLADYIVFAMDREERKQKKILTDNHMVTVNKREVSYEGMMETNEENNNKDSFYNYIANDKNIIFQPKVSITEQDIKDIPELAKLREAILEIEDRAKHARGKQAYYLKKQAIEMRQDQYVIKNMFKKPIKCMNLIKSFNRIDLSEHIWINEDGSVESDGLLNFFNEEHVSAILCNYSRLKEDSWSDFGGDAKWMLMDFEELVDKTLKNDYPMLYRLMIYKIDGRQNIEIQELLFEEFGIKHSVEYLSSLWRNKIPKLIVEQATKGWLEWHFTIEEKGQWKRCSRCHQIKLAHNLFFSKNSTSKDGYYSICKDCRNKK